MDADQIRSIADDIKRELLAGRAYSRENVTAEPSPEMGYLLHARGLTWHRGKVEDIVVAFIQELGRRE